MKVQKKEILTKHDIRHSSRFDVVYFLLNAYFLKTILLLTYFAHIAKASLDNDPTKALPKGAILRLLGNN